MLFLDLSRQILSFGILTDYNATAAFHHVLTGLSVITSQCLGLTRIAALFMYQLLKNMSFHLITGFGRSILSCKNHENHEIGQGVLQGSSSAAPLHIYSIQIYHYPPTKKWAKELPLFTLSLRKQ
jgi:hypothetical protein